MVIKKKKAFFFPQDIGEPFVMFIHAKRIRFDRIRRQYPVQCFQQKPKQKEKRKR